MSVSRKIAIFSLTLFIFAWNHAQADSSYKPTGALIKEDVLIFGPFPYSNPEDIFEDYEPIMRYLEQKLPGTHFRVEASKDYADYETKLAAQHFHFSLSNPYQTILGLKQGYRVVAKMAPDKDFRGLIVARTDKNLHSPKDLIGKTVCFPSPSAVAATMLPLLFLHDQGIDVKKGIHIRYVGSMYSSILNTYTGEAAACGTSVRFWRTWSRKNPDKAKEMQVLWQTTALPHNAIVARSDIGPRLAQQVASVLVGMDEDKELDQKQFKAGQQHFELAGNATYKPMQEFLRRYDQAIGLPPSMEPLKTTQ